MLPVMPKRLKAEQTPEAPLAPMPESTMPLQELVCILKYRATRMCTLMEYLVEAVDGSDVSCPPIPEMGGCLRSQVDYLDRRLEWVFAMLERVEASIRG